MGSIVGLVNLVRWEVGCVDIGLQFRLEGGANTAKCVELYTAEELVGLDFVRTATAKAVFGVTNHANIFSQFCKRIDQIGTFTFESGSRLRDPTGHHQGSKVIDAS